MTGDEFIAAARSYMGAPFAHQGRVPDGLDCIGLLVLAARDCGYDPIDFTVYPRRGDVAKLIDYLEMNCDSVAWEDQQDGDIIVFRVPRRPQHVAILCEGQTRLLHTDSKAGRVVEIPFTGSWRTRVHSLWRWS